MSNHNINPQDNQVNNDLMEGLLEYLKLSGVKIDPSILEKDHEAEDLEPTIEDRDGENEVRLDYTNSKKSIESMHTIVFDLMRELTKLEDEGMILTECHVQCKYIENPNPDDVQEYEQFTDDETGDTITIDKTSIGRNML